jgi:hypothetical protein
MSQTNLQTARAALRVGRAYEINDRDLIALSLGIEDSPAKPSSAAEWAEREAVPLINELGRRLQAAKRWFIADAGHTISADGLAVMGFRREETSGVARYVLDSVSDVAGCHLALHLLPDFDGAWIVEIHNWQTDGGEPVCDVDQRVGLHKRVRTYGDVRNVMRVAAEMWEVPS